MTFEESKNNLNYIDNLRKKDDKIVGFCISAFPTSGKTYLYNNQEKFNLKIADSDSSKFSWLENGQRNPNFAKDYINEIKQRIIDNDIVMVSSHKDVLQALWNDNIATVVFYPYEKDVVMKRLYSRNSNQSLIDIIDNNFEKFLNDIKQSKSLLKIKSNNYLSEELPNVLLSVYNEFYKRQWDYVSYL